MAGKVVTILRSVVLVSVLLMVLVVGAVGWVVGSESGARFALQRAHDTVPQLALGTVSGTVWRGLEVEGVRYAEDGLSFEAERLWWLVDWPTVLGGELLVRRVGLADARLRLPAGEAEPQPRGAFELDLDAMLPALPLGIRVDELLVERLGVVTGPGADPVQIDRLRLQASVDVEAAQVEVHELSVAGPAEIQLSAQARLALMAPYSLALTVNAAAAVEAGTVELVMHSSGPLEELTSSGSLHWIGREWPSADMRFDVVHGFASARINALLIETLAGGVSVEGDVAWGQAMSWALQARARELRLGELVEVVDGPLGFDLVSEGRFDADGSLAHVTRLEGLSGSVAGAGFEDVRLQVSGDLAEVVIDSLSGRVLDARLAGAGRVTLGEPLRWNVDLTLDQADLGLLAEHVQPTPSGWVGFDLSSHGELRDGVPFGEVSLSQLRGMIDGQALAGQVQARIADQSVRVSPADIRVGDNRVVLAGQLTPPFDLVFELALPTLETLPMLPQFGIALAGAIEGQGEIGGTPSAPHVDATLVARNLKLDETLALAQLDVRAELVQERVAVSARLNDLQAGDETVREIDLRATGSLSSHQLQLDALTDHGRITLAAEGGMVDAAGWRGQLQALSLADTVAGTWALDAPAPVSLAGADFSLDALCLADAAQRGHVCANAARVGDQPIRAEVEGSLALAMAQDWLPPELSLPGTLRFAATARVGARIDADARVELPDDVMLFSGLVDESLAIEYRDVAVDVGVVGDRVEVRLGATLPEYGRLDGELQAVLGEQGPLSGRVGFEMEDIAWIQALVPDLTDLAGRVRAELVLAGTLDQPRPQGQLQIEDIAVTVPMTGVGFDRGEVVITIDHEQTLTASGRLNGREHGEVRIAGEGSAAMPDWWLALRVDGEALAVMRTPEIDLDVSPALSIRADRHRLNVSGQVELPLVAVRVHTLPEGSVSESPDLVLADATDPVAPAYAVRTDVTIVLGDRVTLEGMGFSTGLAGQIRVRGDETAPIDAFGEVDLRDGRFSAYGQNLAVDRGRLSFNGPLDDPGLDVRASRTVGEFQAGLEIRGTLMHPHSQVFSVPALPESDALSLLLTGRLLSAGTSGADATLLVNALAGLGVAQGDEIMRDIGQTVGFDEFGLDTGNGLGETELTVGKRLNSRLMVRYAVGVFDGVGRFVTEYRINRFLDLEIVSSPVAQGGDLIFRVER